MSKNKENKALKSKLSNLTDMQEEKTTVLSNKKTVLRKLRKLP